MACAIHGHSSLCDTSCAGFIHGLSDNAQSTTFDPKTAQPPFASYAQLVEAFAAQHPEGAAPTEAFAREQGWLADGASVDE